MKCLEREQLFAFAHGMLETRQAAVVRAHIVGCAACQEVVMEYQRLDSALDKWKPVEPSAAFDARVRQAVEMQGKARDSSLRGGLFALTWARWLAPASLAVVVGAVALGLYRSHRVSGPAAPESSAQRLSPAAQHAPQPSAETPQEAVEEKKSVPAPGALPAKQKAGSRMANQEAPAQSGLRPAQSANALTGAGAQSSPQNARSEAAVSRRTHAYGVAVPPAPPGEIQRDAMAHATGVPEATAKPSTPATGGALAWRHAEATNQPQRVLQAAPSASVSAEAQPQPTAAPPAPAGAAEAQVPTALGSLGHQLVATPRKASSAAKSLSSEKGQALASGFSNASPPPGLLETFLEQHPDANLDKELLGRLEGQGATQATFTAIVAADPADASSKAKGLVVQLEDNNRTATVYLDDDREQGTQNDNLRQFQETLERNSSKDEILKFWRSQGFGGGWDLSPFALTGANRAGDSPRYCCPRNVVIIVGWFRRAGEIGIEIVTPNPDARFYFPGIELGQVIKLIAEGRAFLDAN